MVRKFVPKMRLSRAIVDKVMLSLGVVAVGVLCYFFGRSVSRTSAHPRDILHNSINKVASGAPTDYNQRVVAYIHGTIPITREELGEFLISRFGPDRLDFLINRRIIELACKSRNITVTDAMIEAQLQNDLSSMKLTVKDFTKLFLTPKNKTLYEWKEDVIRLKLMMAQLVEPTIQTRGRHPNCLPWRALITTSVAERLASGPFGAGI